jgi:hypothetical protein
MIMVNTMSHTPFSVEEKPDMDPPYLANIDPWDASIAAMKRLVKLDTKRRQKLLELGIVSTSDMYSLEDGERIKNKEELNAFIVKMSNTDTPVDIHTRVEDYGEPRFTPMLKVCARQ